MPFATLKGKAVATLRRWVVSGLSTLGAMAAASQPVAPASPAAPAPGMAVSVAPGVPVAAVSPRIAGLTPEEITWLQRHPVLRLGANRSAPPFTALSGGRHVGIDAELMARLGAALGVQWQLVIDQPWAEIQALAKRHEVDLLSLLPAAPERTAYLAYTDPVTTVEYALFERIGGAGTSPSGRLVGRRVAVAGSFAVRQWIERDHPGVVIVPTASAIEALSFLSTGQADAAVSTLGGASVYVREQGIVNLSMRQVLYRVPLVVGVRKDWPELVTILNKAIAQLDPAEIDRIKAEHVALKGGYSAQQVLIAVLGTALLGLAVIVVLVGAAWRRQRRAAQRLADEVAAREAAQRLLAQRENELRQLFDHSLDALLRTRPDGTVLEANPAACAMFGYSEDELRRGGRKLLADPDDTRLPALVRERDSAGRVRGQARMIRADGTRLEVDISSAVYAGHQGQTLAAVAIRDVTERHRRESQLRMLETCVRHLDDMVVITEAGPIDEPGPRIVYVNDAFTRLTGYRPDEAIGRSPRFLQGPGTDRRELDRIRSALERQQPVRAELLNYAKDRSEFWIEVQIVPVADERGAFTHLVAIEREIGARKQAEQARRELEDRLRESQKMEAIGTLAGGIAHDFNNILGAILGNAALAAEDVGAEHPARARLGQIDRSGHRARDLVRQILTFSRREPLRLSVQPLDGAVREAVELLRITLPSNVVLDLHLSDEPLWVRADATQIGQVLMNLCTNAWHAMGGRAGRIEVRLEAAQVDGSGDDDGGAAGVPLSPRPGRYARIVVSDDGCGMDADTCARLFEPFFTTKPVGQGTGLGMAVVHGIVQSHGGFIRVKSTPGRGTRFELLFPRVDAHATQDTANEHTQDTTQDTTGHETPHAATQATAGAPPTQSTPADPALVGHGEHVLCVDDDEVMLAVTEALLGRLGYHVTCAADAPSALRLIRERSLAFDALITDLNMPGMSGLDLARSAVEARPGLPVVISSGFVSDVAREQARRIGVAAFLHKESVLEEAPAILRRVLDGVHAETA